MLDVQKTKMVKTRRFAYIRAKTLWLTISAYALIITVAISVLFQHKHNPEEVAQENH